MAGQSISKGALVLTTDAAALQAGLSKVQSQIESFSNRVTGLLGASLGFGFVQGTVDQLKALGDESENFLNLSEAFEVNVEKLQAWTLAANLAGIETESLMKAMRIASEKFPNEADPFASLTAALEQLRGISNVQERIKAASELFGGKNAIEVLKIMKADLPGISAELGTAAVMTERQLKAWDKVGDSVSLFMTKVKNVFKKGVANTFEDVFGGDDGKSLPERITEAWKSIDTLQQKLDSGQVHPMFLANVVNSIREMKEAVRELENKLTQANIAEAVAPIAKAHQEMQEAAKAAERFRDAMFSEQANNRLDSAKKFLDFSTPIDQATMAIEHFLGLFDAGLLTALEFNQAIENLGKEFNKLEEVQLPSAAFKGSVEAVGAGIRDSVRGGSDSRIVQNLLRELIDNTRPLKEIGVEN